MPTSPARSPPSPISPSSSASKPPWGLGPSAQKVRAAVTPSFFRLLGVHPLRGRTFAEAEGDPERAAGVVFLSWELWQRSFSGEPNVLGKPLRLGRDVYTVAGVLPRRFTGVDLEAVDLWLPVGAVGALWAGDGWSTNRSNFFLNLIGRLRPGATSTQAAQQATAVHRQAYQARRFSDADGRQVGLWPVQPGRGPYAAETVRLATWLWGTAGAVLLIACANVASLLVVRRLERRRELETRAALGATHARIARLLFAESLLIALLGWVAAYAIQGLGALIVRAFLLPEGVTGGGLDGRPLSILAVLSVTAGILCGLVPAFWGNRRSLTAEIWGAAGGADRPRIRGLLLVGQVALTFVLRYGLASRRWEPSWVASSWPSPPVFEPLLFQVSAHDPGVLATAVVTVLSTGALASYLPGRRIRRIDPAETMRAE